MNEDGTLKRKADMFTKRTIKKAVAVTSVETATEALALSLNERAKVDLPYMAKLTGKTEEKITEELVGVIFKNPLTDQWESGDEYLSGNVRDKLNTARTFAENRPEFTPNVRALRQFSREIWKRLRLRCVLELHGLSLRIIRLLWWNCFIPRGILHRRKYR